MRLIVQRVSQASVKVEGKVVGEIGKGYLTLVGIKKGDSKKEAELLAEKLSKLRVMADKEGKMNLSLNDLDAYVLVVSLFMPILRVGIDLRLLMRLSPKRLKKFMSILWLNLRILE